MCVHSPGHAQLVPVRCERVWTSCPHRCSNLRGPRLRSRLTRRAKEVFGLHLYGMGYADVGGVSVDNAERCFSDARLSPIGGLAAPGG